MTRVAYSQRLGNSTDQYISQMSKRKSSSTFMTPKRQRHEFNSEGHQTSQTTIHNKDDDDDDDVDNDDNLPFIEPLQGIGH